MWKTDQISQDSVNHVIEECSMSSDCSWLEGDPWKVCPSFRLKVAQEIWLRRGREYFGLQKNESYLSELSNTLRCGWFELRPERESFLKAYNFHFTLCGPHDSLFRRCGVMNKPESTLLRILNDAHTGTFKFVGNRPTVGRWKPDFLDTKGKLAIEMFGDYWHKDDIPEERIALFQEYGIRTAIIWEHALFNEDLIKKTLREFCLGTRHSVVIA
jgi:G:T-mismatch repair DNA endonuclease (very short patch repair protein)